MKNRIEFIKLIRVWGILFLVILGVSLISFDTYFNYKFFNVRVNEDRKDFVLEKKREIKREVDRVVDMINFEKKRNKDLNKEGVLKRISSIRFGEKNKNYLFVIKFDGILIASDVQKERIGENIWNFTDSKGVKIVQKELEIVKDPRGGFFKYSWYKPGTNEISSKTAFVRGIKEWNWIIGAGVFLDDLEFILERNKSLLDEKIKLKISTFVLVFIILIVAYILFFNRLTSKAKQDFDLISTFFKKAAFSDELINYDNFKFVEFVSMAKNANKMLNDKMIAEKNLLNGDGVIVTDLDGKVLRLNPVAEELTGWKISEAKNKLLNQVFNIVNAQTRDLHVNPVEKVLKTKKIIELENHTILISKDKKEYHIADSAAPIKNKKNEIIGVVLVFRDVTEKYILQNRSTHSNKMEAIGQLAGGVAHDFNNMLGAILGATQLLKLKKDKFDSKSVELIDLIEQASIQAADLTKKLLSFGRKGKIITASVDFHKVIDESLSILVRTIDKNISVNINKNANKSIIVGDKSELENCLVNLIINASHAMPNGGLLNIETENVNFDQEYCNNSSFLIKPDDYLKIKIEDSGCGISKTDIDKIFEPFFTTKQLGKGTGLGLSAVYGAIQDHYGQIEVFSKIDVGTTFTIYLPCSEKKIEIKEENIDYSKKTGTILLIDDEELVRITAKLMLEEVGYNVIVGENGKEAVELFEKNRKDIDLVLMDMIMPLMNGSEAFYKLREIDKNCKIIIASGYTKEESLNDLKKAGLNGFIHKPFKDFELGDIIEKVLKTDN